MAILFLGFSQGRWIAEARVDGLAASLAD